MANEITMTARRLGHGRIANGNRILVFEATQPFPCEQCGETIPTGARFSPMSTGKRKWTAGGFCQSCRPCRLDPVVEASLRPVDPDAWVSYDEAAVLMGKTIGEVFTLVNDHRILTQMMGGLRRIDAQQLRAAVQGRAA